MMECVLLDGHHPLVEVSDLVCMRAPVHTKLDRISQILSDVTLM